MEYNDNIYAFDIETTTIEDTTHCYLSSFCHTSFYDNGLDKIHLDCFCRTIEDIDNFLCQLNDLNLKTIIYCHNLSFEFDYLIKNSKFVKEHFDNNKSLFIKSRKPLYFDVGNISFRCSLMLFNKSIKALGMLYNLPKLEIDYQRKYFEFSELPQIEYDYNKRDNEIVLLAIQNLKVENEHIQFVKDIPLTSTGIVRKANDTFNDRIDVNDMIGQSAYQKKYSDHFIEFLKKVYLGAYTHANCMYSFIPVRNVLSFDIISSYPFVLFFCHFPKFFNKYKGKHKTEYFKKLLPQFNYIEAIKNFGNSFKHHFLVKIKLKNVICKREFQNIITPISYSKCENVKGVILDNGRILSCEKLTTYITEIDYYIYTLFYNFEIEKVIELYTTNTHYLAPAYIRKSIERCADEKATMKRILHKVEQGETLSINDFYNERKVDYIFSKCTCNNILQNYDEELIRTLLMNSKNKFNGLYGIQVQELKPNIINYDCESDIYTETKGNFSKIYKRDYIIGIYTTAYARLNLFLWAKFMSNNGAKLIYSDTDSYKITGITKEKALQLNDKYNRMLKDNLHNDELYNIGLFEYEGFYSDFCTLGCKKYIMVENGNVKVTIAGLNKIKMTEVYNYWYNYYDKDFDFLVKLMFKPYTLFDSSIINKLIPSYYNNHYDLNVTDENGKTGTITGCNCVTLNTINSTLFELTKENNMYLQLCEDIQGKIFDFPITYFYKENNSYKWKSITMKEFKRLKGNDN